MFRVRSKPTCFLNGHFRLFARSQSICSGLEGGFSEGLWNFLRQIVPDAACDEPMLVLAGEFLRLRVRSGIHERRPNRRTRSMTEAA
jgi:hypothetical protein